MQLVPGNRRWWALALLATAQFLVIKDTSIIGVALSDIQADPAFSPSDLSWVFNVYVIAFGGLLLLGGKLADLYGARRIFAIGLAGLTVSSLLVGLADTTGLEVAARALQGGSAALIAPTSLSMLFALFGSKPRELTRALAVYGAAAPAGGTAGVFLGGVLTEWLDWRWVVYVNIPVGLMVLASTRSLLPDMPRQRQARLGGRSARHGCTVQPGVRDRPGAREGMGIGDGHSARRRRNTGCGLRRRPRNSQGAAAAPGDLPDAEPGERERRDGAPRRCLGTDVVLLEPLRPAGPGLRPVQGRVGAPADDRADYGVDGLRD